MSAILECRCLCKRYGKHEALRQTDITIQPGRIVGLLGPNGSGKTTLIKLICGLLQPDSGELLVGGQKPGVRTKAMVSYLPERTYLSDWMRAKDVITYFSDFYADFDPDKARNMLWRLNISETARMKTLSKGNREKLQLILVMSRNALFYVLDEPIGGVDPAARDYVLDTILTNYNPQGSILISTHLISDVERVLDDVIFLREGQVVTQAPADDIRASRGKSVDEVFREVFKC